MRLALGLVLLLPVHAAAQVSSGAASTAVPRDARRPMTVEDAMAVRAVMEAQIAPDGARVAYLLSRPDVRASLHRTEIRLVGIDGHGDTLLVAGDDRKSHLRWSPDGASVGFISDRAPGGTQVWTVASAGGEARPLPRAPGPVRSFAWSPEGGRIAVVAAEPETPEQARRRTERDDAIVVDEPSVSARLHVLTLAGGQRTTVDTEGLELDADAPRWSPDGTRLTFAAHRANPSSPVRTPLEGDIYVADARDGAVTRLVAGLPLSARPKWSPDGTRIAFLSAGDSARAVAAFRRVFVVPASGGAPRLASGGRDLEVRDFAWHPGGDTLYLSARSGVTEQLFAAALRTGEWRAVTAGATLHRDFSFSKDGARVAFLWSDPQTPWEVATSPLRSFARTRLTHANPQLAEIALAESEVVRWKSSDGVAVEGILVRPVGYVPGRRYPLVTMVHGGPNIAFGLGYVTQLGTREPQVEIPVHLLAAQGYAVLLPNPRGSSGYGLRFLRANLGDFGGGDYRDVMAGVDHVIARGIADPARLAIWGGSYGGYLAAWSVTQTRRFKAAVVVSGIANWRSHFATADIDFVRLYFGGPPGAAGDIYDRRSPVMHAYKARTPVLLIHGERDDRVPLSQAQEFYRALREVPGDEQLVVLPRQGHFFREPKLQAEHMRRTLGWLARWLSAATS